MKSVQRAPAGDAADPLRDASGADDGSGSDSTSRWRWDGEVVLLVVSLVGLGAGVAAGLAGADRLAACLWVLTTLAGLGPATWWVIEAVREGRLGADVIAVLALAGTLAVGEYVAGAVITVMLASGRVLEARARMRARGELRALLERAPRVVHRRVGDEVVDAAVETVRLGDRLLVKPGEVLPVDGTVVAGVAVIDESALTGEPLPVDHRAGDQVRSGTVNAGASFDLQATTTAEQSTYAGIVRLVSEAEADTAPFVRLADRYAGVFLAVSLAVAALAWWWSGDATRAVAVLVVATPCPLILAVPVAIVSGLSRAAQRGVIIKGGTALERLAAARVLLFDKTGTLTEGRPTVAEIVPADGIEPDEVLRLAASLDQLSPHVLAAAVVKAARDADITLSLPKDVEEVAGSGACGTVDGHAVSAGKAAWVVGEHLPRWARAARRRADLDGALTVFVARDGQPIGAIVLDDPIRADAGRTVRRMHHDGIDRIVMVTGDRADVAETVGAVLGVDEVLAERTPADKLDTVRDERRYGPTIMVGDGINDAPALALADVGVAIGARGATASSEAADIVLTVDRLDRLGEALTIARRARRIATQSVVLGIGLSALAMIAATAGLLAPTLGAIAQEAIDVAAIANALRVLRGRPRTIPLGPHEQQLARRFSAEHESLRHDLDQLRTVADTIGTVPPAEAVALVRNVQRFLVERVEPHERAEDAELYPVLARILGGDDPTATMTRAHIEISRLIRRLGRLAHEIEPDTAVPPDRQEPPDIEDILEIRRVLYGLHAILRLHTAQEDEGYLSLVDADDAGTSAAAR